MNTLGERVKALRNKHNLSMEALANRLQVATYDKETGEFIAYKKSKSATISNIENNKNRPSVDLALAIADYFEVSLDWLITGEDRTSDPDIVSDYENPTVVKVTAQRFDKDLMDVAVKMLMENMDSIIYEAKHKSRVSKLKLNGDILKKKDSE